LAQSERINLQIAQFDSMIKSAAKKHVMPKLMKPQKKLLSGLQKNPKPSGLGLHLSDHDSVTRM
jgi:hypothetical protein